MEREYKVFLEDKLIGTSLLEFGDPGMGVAFGKLHTNQSDFGYDFLRQYCETNGIQLALHEPEDQLISSMSIQKLHVFNQEEIEIKANANQITCFKQEYVEISLQGITEPEYNVEFLHHVLAHEEKLNDITRKNDL